jgi:hypothetical protein
MKTLRMQRLTGDIIRVWIEGPDGEEWIEGRFEPWLRDWLEGGERRLTVLSGDGIEAWGVLEGGKR